jgi:methionyl-tRNA formyltransferase
MGSHVTIVFLTTDDPIYLPSLFDRVFKRYGRQTLMVYAVPPLYKEQTVVQAAWRYFRTFGFGAVVGLAVRTSRAKLRRQSIAAVCARHHVPYAEAQDVNAPEFLDELRKKGPDVIVSVSCPQIFKTPLIDLPPKGLLNVHGAILPQYRGVMPSFWMLANGEQEAGVSIYFVNEQIDAGDLCGQRVFDISSDESLDAFLRRSKAIAADLLVDVLDEVERGEANRTPLDLSLGSYYSWPDKDAVRRFRASGRRLW